MVIAAITSCTNTSNPSVLIAAGLLARNAVAKGLAVKPWVKTSLAPGQPGRRRISRQGRPAEAARQARLQSRRLRLHDLHRQFRPAGAGDFGDNAKHDLVAAAVLSGNRNFEGRVNPDVQANYLASPPLVVAYALAGSMQIDLTKEPLGHDKKGKPVFLRDIWPSTQEIQDLHRAERHGEDVQERLRRSVRRRRQLAQGQGAGGPDLRLGHGSTYVRNPPYFEGMTMEPQAGRGHRRRAHSRRCSATRSPPTTSRRPARSRRRVAGRANGCIEHRCAQADFNQYGTRRGNHEVMMRGTFANIRIKNSMVKDADGDVPEGGYTMHYPWRRAHVDLRRGDAIPERGRAARRLRRRRIWQRLLARLGGQGHHAARRARGDRAELRAHPPLQSRRHGRAAADFRGGNELAVARPRRATRP